MAARVDNLLDYRLEETLKRLRATLDELKNRQFYGTQSLKVKLSQTTNTWDISTSVAFFTTKNYRVTFTPASAKNVYATIEYLYSAPGGNGFETIEFYPDPSTPVAGSRSWVVSFTTDAQPVTLNLKFFVCSVDTGTITWVAI